MSESGFERLKGPEAKVEVLPSEQEVQELFRVILESMEVSEGVVTKREEDEKGLSFLEMRVELEGGEALELEYVRQSREVDVEHPDWVKYPRIDIGYLKDGEYVDGDTAANYDHGRGEWRVLPLKSPSR